MYSCYYNGLVPMKPEMKNVDLVCEDDECSFEVPEVYFEGTSETHEQESMFNCDTDSVLVHKGKRIVKYTESTFFEILLIDEKDETNWLDGRLANILGADVNDVEEVRPTNEYRIEEYDLEKSLKRRYKVILEETLDIDEYEQCNIEKILKEENSNRCYC